jgi:hypothetical protein
MLRSVAASPNRRFVVRALVLEVAYPQIDPRMASDA